MIREATAEKEVEALVDEAVKNVRRKPSRK